MRFSFRFLAVVTMLAMAMGCAKAEPQVQLEAHEDVGYCVVTATGKSFPIGTMYGGSVLLFDRFGGEQRSIYDLNQVVSKLTPPVGGEEAAVNSALFAYLFSGVWQAEHADNANTPAEDYPIRLDLLADQTFRLERPGSKLSGTWEYNAKHQLVTTAATGASTTLKVNVSRKTMTLTAKENEKEVRVRYSRISDAGAS